LTANIGLCLFLFLVGLEIDASVVKRNARLSAAVALAGMILPFGLGTGLSVPLYHHFIDQSVKYTNFMLFTGVAYSITAFPVLCRILLELKLLDTTVGIVVLSAGVGNDIGELWISNHSAVNNVVPYSGLDPTCSKCSTCKRRIRSSSALDPSELFGIHNICSYPGKVRTPVAWQDNWI
jgi:hypothetical protein